MSEIINNREYRQKKLKELITELHNGKTVEAVKAEFEELIKGVSPTEISEMEQSLIMGGMPVEEIQRLCDVHAAVFKGSIEEIHRNRKPEETEGHPINTFYLENRALEDLMNNKIKNDLDIFNQNDSKDNLLKLIEDFNLLWDIDKHYKRKENLLFPYMEKYGITAPPKVMWGVDDEIRQDIKKVRNELKETINDKEAIITKINEVINRINEMIFKEENILFPMVVDTLSEDEWFTIHEDSVEIGYCLTEPKAKWKPIRNEQEIKKDEKLSTEPTEKGYIKFESGIMSTVEIESLLNTLPFDVTFVDKDGLVKYFSLGKERIFPRTKSIIGREVNNCHPPASVHIVEKIVEDLKSGKKDHEDFWIKMGNKFVYIRYFAVRNQNGEFLGTLEVTQDIKPITQLEGEKRLMSE